MKKRSWKVISIALLTSLIMAIAFSSLALAASINPSQIGSFCAPGQTGVWHFVNNQTGGAAAGLLTATFADAGTKLAAPDKVLGSTQHFYITGPAGPLQSASTDLPGKLVLSDLTCTGGGTETKTPDPSKTPDPTKAP